jgi:hypothetical protein
MTKTFVTTTRGLLLAGALAFAALPVLAQTAPSPQPAAPAAGSTVTPAATPATGKSATGTGTSHLHSKKIAAAPHAKSKVHTVSSKKPVDSKAQKPMSGAASGAGTVDTGKKP